MKIELVTFRDKFSRILKKMDGKIVSGDENRKKITPSFKNMYDKSLDQFAENLFLAKILQQTFLCFSIFCE